MIVRKLEQRPETPINTQQRTPNDRSWLLLAAYVVIVGLICVVWFWSAVPRSDYALTIGAIAATIIGNASCAIVGCYLVLRRMSLLGDAISHAVLPGIALAFLATGQISGLPIILGAMALGVVTSVMTHSLHKFGNVSEDSSMGVVFTTLFALGVILIQTFAAGTHLDADCVLYGQADITGIDIVDVAGLSIPRAVLSLAPVLVFTLLFVAGLWKELKIVAFDPALATAMGMRVLLIHYALMAMVAGVAVASFESLGSILVVAMLVILPASAHVMSDRLAQMMCWAVAFGASAAVLGYLAGQQWNVMTSGTMAVVAALQLAATVLFAPRNGLVSRWLRNFRLAVRIAAEDVIGQLYRGEERKQQPAAELATEAPLLSPPTQMPIRPVLQKLATWNLRRKGLAERGAEGELQLTTYGRRAARSLVRAHRLWETYLDTHFNLPRDHLHAPAERMEHFLDERLQAELDADLADHQVDPHGKAIPRDRDA